jgi:hypothetical protein
MPDPERRLIRRGDRFTDDEDREAQATTGAAGALRYPMTGLSVLALPV